MAAAAAAEEGHTTTTSMITRWMARDFRKASWVVGYPGVLCIYEEYLKVFCMYNIDWDANIAKWNTTVYTFFFYQHT